MIVILDCSEQHRTGLTSELARKKRAPILVIDHHPLDNLKDVATCYIHDSSASSTTELVAGLIDRLDIRLTASIAQALLLGIYTDTGGLRFRNTSASTLELVGRLLQAGADVETNCRSLIIKATPSKLKLWGLLVDEARLSRWGVVSVVVRQEHLDRCQASESDLTGLASSLLALDGAKASLIMLETSAGWRACLRSSEPEISAVRLARFFGGSGNRQIANFTLSGQLSTLK